MFDKLISVVLSIFYGENAIRQLRNDSMSKLKQVYYFINMIDLYKFLFMR